MSRFAHLLDLAPPHQLPVAVLHSTVLSSQYGTEYRILAWGQPAAAGRHQRTSWLNALILRRRDGLWLANVYTLGRGCVGNRGWPHGCCINVAAGRRAERRGAAGERGEVGTKCGPTNEELDRGIAAPQRERSTIVLVCRAMTRRGWGSRFCGAAFPIASLSCPIASASSWIPRCNSRTSWSNQRTRRRRHAPTRRPGSGGAARHERGLWSGA